MFFEYDVPYAQVAQKFVTEPRSDRDLVSLVREEHWNDAILDMIGHHLLVNRERNIKVADAKLLFDCMESGKDGPIGFMLKFVGALIELALANSTSEQEQRLNFLDTLSALHKIDRQCK